MAEQIQALARPQVPDRPRPPRRPRVTSRTATTVALSLLGFVFTGSVWWLATIVFDIPPTLLPAPPDVVDAFGFRPDHMAEQTWATVRSTLLGFVAAVVGGLILAVAVTASRTVNRAFLPQIVAVNAIPKVAIAPMLVVWLGFGQAPRVVLSFLIAFFPIVVATIAGLNSVPADLGELSRSLSASRLQTFAKVRFRWALPQVFVGLKLGITLSVIGTVVAEMQVPNEGLGAVIKTASASSDMARAFAGIVVLMVLSVSLFYTVVAIERLTLPWARATSAYAS